MDDDGRSTDLRTARTAGVPPATIAAPVFALTVVDGADKGASLRLEASMPSRGLVGKSPACALRLSDPHVSRRHLALDPTDQGLHLTDLGSTNGTYVNGLRVVEAYLLGGEAVRIGETTLRVDLLARAEQVNLDKGIRFGRMIGSSPSMRRLYPLCARIASSNVPVVIEGETGTGKEILAESLHEASRRADGPFVVFDCTAVPANLVESALFGHERGAFTGAIAPRRGVFEQAHGGTLFIDEIGDLDVSLQSRLLRAIERSEVQRVGGERWMKVDVRVIAATRRDLDRAVQEGRFRDDLFFRLAVARIELPPLRDRQGDVALLVRHFWRIHGGAGSPDEFLARYDDHTWPGNVRELSNAVGRYVALGELAPTYATTGPPPASAPAPASSPDANASSEPDVLHKVLAMDLPLARARHHVVEEFERLYVDRVLKQYGGDVAQAASASGIGRRYFQMLRARQSR